MKSAQAHPGVTGNLGRSCLLVFDAPDGGVAEHVMRLALGLGDRGWRPWLAGPRSAVVYPALAEAGIPIARLPFEPGYGRAAQDMRALRSLAGLLRRHRFDLVNTHSPKSGILGRLAANAAGVPVIATAHGFAFNPAERSWAAGGLSLGIEHLLARRTNAYICVSEAVRRQGLERRLGPPEALRTIHNGAADCDEALEPDAELERLASEGPLAGSITVLRPGKGADVFLQAAPQVLNRLPNARLALIGNGVLRPELEHRAAALGLDERLRFFDYRGPSSRQLRSLDVFVNPSGYEAFGIALAEAMACGVPQVATDAGATPEVVLEGSTALLSTPNDPRGLAEHIVRLLGDESLRASMSEASRRRYRENFTLDRMLDGTAAFFDEVTQRNGSV